VVQPCSIINCVVEGRSWDVQHWIETLSKSNCMDYFSLQQAFSDELEPIEFLMQSDVEIIKNDFFVLNEIYSRLSDQQSKREFESVLNFRYNRDIRYMKDFNFRLKDQYFESFLDIDDNPVFIDGGGFNGQTSLEFSKLYPNYASIHYFEPSPEYFAVSKKVLQSTGKVQFYNSGLWSSKGIMQFNPSLNSASRFDENGGIRVATTTIDEAIIGKVSFIKLDIEGAEKEAIEGAENTIRSFKPAMAVCVYHKQEDYFKVPLLLLSYHPDYKIYFRHYTQGVFESVMYFI
jgi:FkbM family methyltransferase